jgi:hypothetical protein
MLLQTVLNLFGKAKYKDHIYVRVVLYANDATSLLVVPLLVAISPNIDIRINTRVDLGYDGIDHLYRLGAEGIQTTLQTVYTDRTHILTAGVGSIFNNITLLLYCGDDANNILIA